MLKYLFLPLLLLTLGVSSARAAADDPTGKVTSVEGNQVTLQVTGDMPMWARTGGYLKAIDSDGKVVVRRGKIAKVEGRTVVITSAEAKEVKVGKVYKLGKARVNEGC